MEAYTEWPFYVILTVVYLFIYAWSIFASPPLREPVRLAAFTVLMGVHILLHWLSPRLPDRRWQAGYLVLQAGLAFAIVFLAGGFGPLLGLYMGLIGEIIGLLRDRMRWAIVAVVACLGLSLINYGLMVGWVGWSWWLLAIVPMTFFVIVYVVLYSRQAEARARAQALLGDLETANRQLSEYAARVEDLTVVAERQRMARELHDTLSQGLAGLILQLEAVDAHLANDRLERARTIVQQTMVRARATLSDARLAIDDLRRTEPRDLESVARQEAGHFMAATGIPCDLKIDLPAAVPESISETASRAVSEGLTNIARHARASRVKLSIVVLNNQLDLELCDDGVGFDPLAVQPGHYGLLGLNERVRLAGGSCELRSASGEGTCIKIRFPLEKVPHG